MAGRPLLQKRTDAILRRLVRRDAGNAVRKVLAKTRPQDVAAAMEHLTGGEQLRLFSLIDQPEHRANLLPHLGGATLRRVSEGLSVEVIVDLVSRMQPDDATDIIESLDEDVRTRVVQALDDDGDDDVTELLAWRSDTAGGIMSNVVFTQDEEATCAQAIAALQRGDQDFEAVFYVYCIDADQRLTGVAPLRRLLVNPPNTPIREVMARDVIAVGPFEDQEEVARIVARYDLLAVPVVDDQRRLLGIVTVDDVVDVIREEAAEDMLRLAGVQELEPSARSVLWLVRQRIGWLFATCVAGVIADQITTVLGQPLPLEALAGFIPVVMGMGGNVGVQSATIAVRGLAVGHVQLSGSLPFVFRELRVGIVLGLFYGLLIGGYGVLVGRDDPMIGVTVALSVILAIVLGSALGSGLPVLLSRLGVDPAVATGPFVTSAVDIMGIVVYFSIAAALLGIG